MKISIITISLNNKKVIKETIESVLSQNFSNIEYIIIDGGSTDGSIDIINAYSDKIDCFISESDNGIYSAINKGLKIATGEVIGLLHAGDLFYDNNVLSKVKVSFKENNPDLIYGHSIVFDKNRDKLVRKNISPIFKDNLMKFGWFPSHQSIYFKANILKKCGFYNESYKISGDYEFLLRVLLVFKLKAIRIDSFLVKFYLGGASSKNIISLMESNYECYKAWKNNNLNISIYTLPLKVLRKLGQNFLQSFRYFTNG